MLSTVLRSTSSMLWWSVLATAIVRPVLRSVGCASMSRSGVMSVPTPLPTSPALVRPPPSHATTQSSACPGTIQTGARTLAPPAPSSTSSPFVTPKRRAVAGASNTGLSQTILPIGRGSSCSQGLFACRPSQQAGIGPDQQRQRARWRSRRRRRRRIDQLRVRLARRGARHHSCRQRVRPGIVVQPVAPRLPDHRPCIDRRVLRHQRQRLAARYGRHTAATPAAAGS